MLHSFPFIFLYVDIINIVIGNAIYWHGNANECCCCCFAAHFSSFPKENAFQNLEENLWTIKPKTEFPDFSLTLTISKIFPDFLKNFLTFPWWWQPCYLNRFISVRVSPIGEWVDQDSIYPNSKINLDFLMAGLHFSGM